MQLWGPVKQLHRVDIQKERRNEKLLPGSTGWSSCPEAITKKDYKQDEGNKAQAEVYCPRAIKEGKAWAGGDPEIQRVLAV